MLSSPRQTVTQKRVALLDPPGRRCGEGLGRALPAFGARLPSRYTHPCPQDEGPLSGRAHCCLEAGRGEPMHCPKAPLAADSGNEVSASRMGRSKIQRTKQTRDLHRSVKAEPRLLPPRFPVSTSPPSPMTGHHGASQRALRGAPAGGPLQSGYV